MAVCLRFNTSTLQMLTTGFGWFSSPPDRHLNATAAENETGKGQADNVAYQIEGSIET
jgi:hypothetical protein